MNEWEESYKRLRNSIKVLARTVESHYDEIKEALDPNSKLPQEGCPSHESMAELIYRRVKKKFVEVEGAVSDVEKAIRKSGA